MTHLYTINSLRTLDFLVCFAVAWTLADDGHEVFFLYLLSD
jgi:hypothetical protein